MTFNTNLAIVTVNYWDDFDKTVRTDNIIVNGASLSEIADEIETWAGKDIAEVTIHLLENGPIRIPSSMVSRAVDGFEDEIHDEDNSKSNDDF